MSYLGGVKQLIDWTTLKHSPRHETSRRSTASHLARDDMHTAAGRLNIENSPGQFKPSFSATTPLDSSNSGPASIEADRRRLAHATVLKDRLDAEANSNVNASVTRSSNVTRRERRSMDVSGDKLKYNPAYEAVIRDAIHRQRHKAYQAYHPQHHGEVLNDEQPGNSGSFHKRASAQTSLPILDHYGCRMLPNDDNEVLRRLEAYNIRDSGGYQPHPLSTQDFKNKNTLKNAAVCEPTNQGKNLKKQVMLENATSNFPAEARDDRATYLRLVRGDSCSQPPLPPLQPRIRTSKPTAQDMLASHVALPPKTDLRSAAGMPSPNTSARAHNGEAASSTTQSKQKQTPNLYSRPSLPARHATTNVKSGTPWPLPSQSIESDEISRLQLEHYEYLARTTGNPHAKHGLERPRVLAAEDATPAFLPPRLTTDRGEAACSSKIPRTNSPTDADFPKHGDVKNDRAMRVKDLYRIAGRWDDGSKKRESAQPGRPNEQPTVGEIFPNMGVNGGSKVLQEEGYDCLEDEADAKAGDGDWELL